MSDEDYLGYNPEWDDELEDQWEWGGSAPSDAERSLMRELLDNYGVKSFGEIIINLEDVKDPSTLRGNRFSTLLEALFWLHDIGVLGFSQVVYYGEDEYGANVPDNTP